MQSAIFQIVLSKGIPKAMFADNQRPHYDVNWTIGNQEVVPEFPVGTVLVIVPMAALVVVARLRVAM